MTAREHDGATHLALELAHVPRPGVALQQPPRGGRHDWLRTARGRVRDRFVGVIESATGRRVIGFMSGNQQHPDMMCEVFILAPSDLLDHDETAAGGSAI